MPPDGNDEDRKDHGRRKRRHSRQDDHSDSEDDPRRGNKKIRSSSRKHDRKKKKSKKKDKKRGRERNDDSDSRAIIDRSSSSESSVDSNDRSKHEGLGGEEKRKTRKERRRDDYESDEDGSDRDDGHHRRRSKKVKKEKKKHGKKEKKKKKKRRTRRSSSSSSSRSRSPDVERRRRRRLEDATSRATPTAPPGAHELARSLTDLLGSYPAMSSFGEGGIPLLLLKISSGTEYNFSQVPDRALAQKLDAVFEAMTSHGVSRIGGNGAWSWSGGPTGGSELALLRLARALLDGVGVTVDAVEKFEAQKVSGQDSNGNFRGDDHIDRKEKQLRQQENDGVTLTRAKVISTEETSHKKRVERMTSQLLDRFDPQHGNNVNDANKKGGSLATEVDGICNMLIEGEIINLDGIPDGKLRAALGQLFKLVGLVLVEMEDEDPEEDDHGGSGGGTDHGEDGKEKMNGDQPSPKEESEGGATEKARGYALPESDSGGNGEIETIQSRISEIERVCRFRSSEGLEGAPTAWAGSNSKTARAAKEESSDEEEGPLPADSAAAKRDAPSKEDVKAMADRRSQILAGVKSGMDGHHIPEMAGGREEWMMIPGEHDFLKGVASSTRSRTFKNERNRGRPIAGATAAEGPVDPKVRAEVAAIQRAYEDSRGPRLLDEHRRQVAEKKISEMASGKGDKWTWSRDNNLEDGRRVDKNALHLVLGGAEKELKNKFQGSFGRD